MPYVPALCASVCEKLHARIEQTTLGWPAQVMPDSASLALYASSVSLYEDRVA